MGALFNSKTLKGTKDEVKKQFEQLQDQDRYESGHSYSGGWGQARGLEFTNKSFPNEDDAEEWLQEHCQKWEEAKAVRVGDAWRIGAWCLVMNDWEMSGPEEGDKGDLGVFVSNASLDEFYDIIRINTGTVEEDKEIARQIVALLNQGKATLVIGD